MCNSQATVWLLLFICQMLSALTDESDYRKRLIIITITFALIYHYVLNNNSLLLTSTGRGRKG